MPDLPASLPAHAVAEIEADPSMRDWWLRWAAVGEAKDAARAAKARWHLAGEEYASHDRECSVRDPDECPDCHAAAELVDRLAAELPPAVQAIAEAIRSFKEG